MNVLGLISQLIIIETLRLTTITEHANLLDRNQIVVLSLLQGTRPSIKHSYLFPSNKLTTIPYKF